MSRWSILLNVTLQMLGELPFWTHLPLEDLIVILKFWSGIVHIKFMNIPCETALKWTPQTTFDNNSTLVQLMAWCYQTSYFPSQCWPICHHMASPGHNELTYILCEIRPLTSNHIPDNKIHGANMGPIWGQQDPGGPHVGPVNFVIWDSITLQTTFQTHFFNVGI